MADEAPNWASPELFRLSEQDFEGPNFSRLILRVLRRLDAAFPALIDLTTCIKIATHIDEFTQLWDWLKTQGIVTGAVSNATLTLSGKRSFNEALRQSPDIGGRFLATHMSLEDEETSELLIAILKHHFETFGGPSKQV